MSILVIAIIIAVILITVVVVFIVITKAPALPSGFPKSFVVLPDKIILKGNFDRTGKFNLPFIPNTVSAWVKTDASYDPLTRAGVIIGNHDGLDKEKNSFNFELHNNANPRYYKTNLYEGKQITMSGMNEFPTPFIPNNVWSNIVIVRDILNKSIKYYLNGVEKSILDYSTNPDQARFFDDTIRLTDYIVGNDLRANAGIVPFNGSLSTIRIFKEQLNNDQIKKLYEVDRYFVKKLAPETDNFTEIQSAPAPAATPPAAQSIRYNNNIYRILTSRLNLQL